MPPGICQFFFQFENGRVNQAAQGDVLDACDITIAAACGNQDFEGAAGGHGVCHGGSDLAKQGIGGDNADGADDEVGAFAVYNDGVFPCGGPVGSGL